MRTSQTHPLEIAKVSPAPGLGAVGVTFCPGKKQPFAMSGAWNRDLAADLDRIAASGTAAVLTLVEVHELDGLGVPTLGKETIGRHMQWLHMPIQDVSVPGRDFEKAWDQHGEGLRARIRDGFDVIVHCKGGLGRAGTIACRLLVELGLPPNEALRSVRSARPGAVETAGQEQYVMRLQTVDERQPSTSPEAVRDRAIGALMGLAVGDAVGTTLEFKSRDSYTPLADMVGGGPFKLDAGQWTDDTAMALALADSLSRSGSLDPADLMQRFSNWANGGSYSCTGTCFDIGMTVGEALRRWKHTNDPIAGSTDPMSAGNGSLMRLAPVAVRYWADRKKLRAVAALQSTTTHGAQEAVDACVAYAEMIADAIQGLPRTKVLAEKEMGYTPKIASIIAGSWRGKPRHLVESSGYVAHSLEAALWSIGRTDDFKSAVLTAANLGGDADTTAAITGQLAGAMYGLSGIPSKWVGRLAWSEHIQNVSDALFSNGAQ